jgi:hypothetical protein
MSTSVLDTKYEYAVEKARLIVTKLEQITNGYKSLLFEDEKDLYEDIEVLTTSPFELARSKMNSELINVAVCGAFCAGKSFLISGLIGRLEWYRRKRNDSDFFQTEEFLDGYSSFLPSAPEQTNSCPLAVIPNGIHKNRSRLEVMFQDSDQWEDKSEPYHSEDGIKRKMLAYITDIEEWRSARPRKDLAREAIKARLYVPDMPLPAIIYDLPGIGGAGEKYLDMVHKSIRRSDCVVYVASAIRELSEVELDLLGFIREVASVSKIPVFFVLSQIDREPEWQKVLDKNNKFLRQYFRVEEGRKSDSVFIGSGFSAVSPAVQAKASGLYKMGEIDEEERDEAIKKSGMPDFYQILFEHLTNTSGPAHLREIIIQMRGILSSIESHLSHRIQAEMIPINDAKEKIKDFKRLSNALIEKRKHLLVELEELKDATLLAAFASSDPDTLRTHLHRKLDSFIEGADVLKDSVRHEIRQRRDEIRDEWLCRDGGLETSWNEAWNNYQKQTILLLHDRINEAVKEASVTQADIMGAFLDPDIPDPDDITFEQTMGFVSDAWDLVISVTGLGGGIASTVAALGGTAAAFGPLGLFLIFAGTVGIGWRTLRREKERKKLRSMLINQLDQYAEHTIGQANVQATQFIDKYKGEISKIVSRLISAQQEKSSILQQRLQSDGDLHRSEVKLEMLRDYKKQIDEVKSDIEDFLDQTS